MKHYSFSQDWFSSHIPIWESIIDNFQPVSILEIGSYEGRSACWLIDRIGLKRDLQITCIDTWNFPLVDPLSPEAKFDQNLDLAIKSSSSKVIVKKLKGRSADVLPKLLADDHSFDMIYVDGSHNGSDVLTDLVLSYQLAKLGGIIICDDYLWADPKFGGTDLLGRPKMAIDSFTSIFDKKVQILAAATNQQTYLQKIA